MINDVVIKQMEAIVGEEAVAVVSNRTNQNGLRQRSYQRQDHMRRGKPQYQSGTEQRRCYNCQQFGHLSYDCPQPKRQSRTPRTPGYQNQPNRDASQPHLPINPIVCNSCGGINHIARNCTLNWENKDCSNCGGQHFTSQCNLNSQGRP